MHARGRHGEAAESAGQWGVGRDWRVGGGPVYPRGVHTLLADPWVAAQVDAAVAPYVGRLSAREVAWMRDQLAETLASDGRAAKLVGRTRPITVAQSGEVQRAGVVVPITAKRSKAAG